MFFILRGQIYMINPVKSFLTHGPLNAGCVYANEMNIQFLNMFYVEQPTWRTKTKLSAFFQFSMRQTKFILQQLEMERKLPWRFKCGGRRNSRNETSGNFSLEQWDDFSHTEQQRGTFTPLLKPSSLQQVLKLQMQVVSYPINVDMSTKRDFL